MTSDLAAAVVDNATAQHQLDTSIGELAAAVDSIVARHAALTDRYIELAAAARAVLAKRALIVAAVTANLEGDRYALEGVPSIDYEMDELAKALPGPRGIVR